MTEEQLEPYLADLMEAFPVSMDGRLKAVSYTHLTLPTIYSV